MLGFAASVLALMVLGWLSYHAATRLIATQKLVSHTREVEATLESGLAILTDAETEQRSYLLTGDGQFLKDSQDAQAQVGGWLKKLRTLTADNPEQQRRLDEIEPLISKRLAILNSRIELRQERGLQAAIADATTLHEGKNAMDQIRGGIAEMLVAEDQLLARRQNAANANAQHSLIIVLTGSALACAVGLLAILRINRDLKLRGQAEEALRQSEERVRLMIEAIKDYAIIMLDPNGQVVSWNEGAQRIKGYTADEIVGQHFSRFYPKEVAESGFLQKELAEATDKGRFEDEGWRVRKDGSRFWANVVITSIRAQSGELLGFVKVTCDLTRRKTAEEQIAQLNSDLKQRAAELETANKELEAFSYSVSHDLRAPLRHIDGFVKLLEKQGGEKLDERGRRYLDIIADSARQMGALIDDLLSFSRMSRAELRRSKVTPESLVHEVVDALQGEIHGRRIVWKVDTLPQIEADPAMLRQVWANLIGNAVKYTRTRDPAEIEIGCNSRQRGIRLFRARQRRGIRHAIRAQIVRCFSAAASRGGI